MNKTSQANKQRQLNEQMQMGGEDNKPKPITPVQKAVRESWAKEQEKITAETKNAKDQQDLYERQQGAVAKYDDLMEMLTKANKNSKTTKAMNNLIPYVYESFGKYWFIVYIFKRSNIVRIRYIWIVVRMRYYISSCIVIRKFIILHSTLFTSKHFLNR